MNILVSYSPEDSELVSAIVSVLCANNRALVCCDTGALRTSGRWRVELAPAVSAADAMLLFWCHHSNTSYEVRKEFTLALEEGKDVLPLLLDGTPLPSRLAAHRSIDFRSRALVIHEQSPEQAASLQLAGQLDAERRIAGGIARQYEELLVMSLAREIELELAAGLRPR
jgi:hypothetical protein